MDVLTFETRWALNNEMKKQVTSSWFIFIQLEELFWNLSFPSTGVLTSSSVWGAQTFSHPHCYYIFPKSFPGWTRTKPFNECPVTAPSVIIMRYVGGGYPHWLSKRLSYVDGAAFLLVLYNWHFVSCLFVPFLQNESDMWIRCSSSWNCTSVLTVMSYTTSWVSPSVASMILKSIFKT